MASKTQVAIKFITFILCLLGTSIATPLVQNENLKNSEIKPIEESQPLVTIEISQKLRQDGEDGEDVDEAVEGLNSVAPAVAQIISGALTGNIGQLFGGVTGTVTDEAAQPGVGAILQGVSVPLSSLWQSGIAAGQRYFNITTPAPPTRATSRRTVPAGPNPSQPVLSASTLAPALPPLPEVTNVQGQNQNLGISSLFSQLQGVGLGSSAPNFPGNFNLLSEQNTAAPTTEEPPPTTEAEDDDEDEDLEFEQKKL